MATAPKRKKEPACRITLTIGDKTYRSSGSTVAEAFEALERPEKIVAKGFFTIERDGSKFERMFMPLKLRLFMRPAYAGILAKTIEMGLKPV